MAYKSTCPVSHQYVHLSQLTNACEECTLLKLVLISIHSSILMYTKTYDVY